jgi:hypothetical protein
LGLNRFDERGGIGMGQGAAPPQDRTPGDAVRRIWRRAAAGWQPLPQMCLALQSVLFGTSVILYRVVGIDVQWSSDAGFLALLAGLVAAWAVLTAIPRDSTPRRRVTDGLAALILLLSLIEITAPMQYGALALRRPFADLWLARADQWLGFDVASLAAWTAHHPDLIRLLNRTYDTLPAQLLIPLLVLPIVGDSDALWEYLWHLHIALIGALLCVALWPVLHVFAYRQFDPLVAHGWAQHATTQIRDLHAGRFHLLAWQEIQGLISFPSVHVAAAFAVTWALRRERDWIWMPVAVVNVGLVSATLLLGLHYATELIATAVLMAASLAMYQSWFDPRRTITLWA